MKQNVLSSLFSAIVKTMRWNYAFVINDYLFVETEGNNSNTRVTIAVVVSNANNSIHRNNNSSSSTKYKTLSRLCGMSLYRP